MMRSTSLVWALVLVVALAASLPVPVTADSGSISRDARGPQPSGDHDSLGGPPTPRVYVLGQPLIFAVGITVLALAAALGAYTFVLARRPTAR